MIGVQRLEENEGQVREDEQGLEWESLMGIGQEVLQRGTQGVRLRFGAMRLHRFIHPSPPCGSCNDEERGGEGEKRFGGEGCEKREKHERKGFQRHIYKNSHRKQTLRESHDL